jgi:hypothetical protein
MPKHPPGITLAVHSNPTTSPTLTSTKSFADVETAASLQSAIKRRTSMPITSANTNPFVGSWNSSWTAGAAGSGKLTINADGTGSYDWKGGRLEGKFKNNNQTYDGTYTQSNGSGTFTFNLRGSDSFEGPYASSDGGGGTWQGTRTG